MKPLNYDSQIEKAEVAQNVWTWEMPFLVGKHFHIVVATFRRLAEGLAM
jgi:hypothetical protein